MLTNLVLFRAYNTVFWESKDMKHDDRARGSMILNFLLVATAIVTTVMMGMINTVPGHTPNVYLAYTLPWVFYTLLLIVDIPLFINYLRKGGVQATIKRARRVLGLKDKDSINEVDSSYSHLLEVPTV